MTTRTLARSFSATELATALGLPLVGAEQAITQVGPLSAAKPGTLCFAKSAEALSDNGSIVISPVAQAGITAIVSPNPRLDFARALQWLAASQAFVVTTPPNIHPTATIGQHAVIGNGATIGEFSVIGHHTVIHDNVTIGARCVIRSGSIIGERGFGYERDNNGIPVAIPHIGGTIIEDDVEIGALTSVCGGTLGNTVIGQHTKIDDHVFIAHNCQIGKRVMIIAHAEISGSCTIGDDAWVGPNACIIQKKTVGNGALIGIGAVVLKDVEPGATMVGNPAKKLEKKA